MKKNTIILIAFATALALTTFKVISAEEVNQQQAPTKTVAYYVANVKEARAKNQLCFDNPDIKASEDCENALHALQISFKGGN